MLTKPEFTCVHTINLSSVTNMYKGRIGYEHVLSTQLRSYKCLFIVKRFVQAVC